MQIKRTASKLGQFLDVISEIREKWQVENKKELWFRGEGKDYEDTKLRPALYRRFGPIALKSPSDLIEIEDELFAHFRHHSTELARTELAGEETGDPWAEYFQMQHHGGPTRLLDWSDGALIALHFALREERDDDRVVYVLDPYWLMDHIENETGDYDQAKRAWLEYGQKHSTTHHDEDEWDWCYLPHEDGHDELPIPRFPLVLDFDHFTRRVSAQRSQFVLMGSGPDFFNRLLEGVDTRISTITFRKDDVPRMRVQLRDAGITESVIFPDLDGLGRELNQLWTERLRESS